MRKTFVVLILFFIILLKPLSATNNISTGILIGLNNSKLCGGLDQLEYVESRFKTGYRTGQFTAFRFYRDTYLHTEIVYSSQGGIHQGIDIFAFEKMTYTLHYFEMPILFKQYIPQYLGNVFIMAGFSIDFLIQGYTSHSGSKTKLKMEDAQNPDIAYVLSTGLDLDQIQVDIRYLKGFRKIIEGFSDDIRISLDREILSLNLSFRI